MPVCISLEFDTALLAFPRDLHAESIPQGVRPISNALYDIFRINAWGEDTFAFCDLDDDTLGVFFVDEADDTINVTTDQDVADRAAAAQVPAFASAPNLVNNAVTAVANKAFLDADDTLFSSLSGDQVESYDMFKDTGTDTTSILIANFDGATGLPLTPSGGNVTIVWGASGIMQN